MGRHPAGVATHGQATCDQGRLQGQSPVAKPFTGAAKSLVDFADQQGGCASTASRCSGWKATIAAAAWGGEIAAADHWEAMMVALRHWRSWSLQWKQRKEAEQMSHKENTSGGKGKEQEGQQHHSDEEIITMVCWKATISGGVVAVIKRRGGNHVEQRKNGGLREHRVLRSWLHGQQCLLRLLRKGSRGFAATLLVAEEATVAGLSS
ncbi:hypothetical protein BHM03_00018809 [Ensete ventricosum]|nr:hypothetical protein BHM03_00018809 [Ensete ventricosum]